MGRRWGPQNADTMVVTGHTVALTAQLVSCAMWWHTGFPSVPWFQIVGGAVVVGTLVYTVRLRERMARRYPGPIPRDLRLVAAHRRDHEIPVPCRYTGRDPDGTPVWTVFMPGREPPGGTWLLVADHFPAEARLSILPGP